MYKEIIIDAITGEVKERSYTESEISEVEAATKRIQKINDETIARQKLRESALAKLVALGLTEDEIAAL